eukprot:g45723.t1
MRGPAGRGVLLSFLAGLACGYVCVRVATLVRTTARVNQLVRDKQQRQGQTQQGTSQSSEHERHLQRCNDIARLSVVRGDQPFGAVLVLRGQQVAEATNTCTLQRDPTGHAETNLMRGLSALGLTRQELAACILYSSTEPCLMCAGAILHGGVQHVVFGCSQTALVSCLGPSRARAQQHVFSLQGMYARLGKAVRVEGPLCEEEGRQVHADFDWPRFLTGPGAGSWYAPAGPKE